MAQSIRFKGSHSLLPIHSDSHATQGFLLAASKTQNLFCAMHKQGDRYFARLFSVPEQNAQGPFQLRIETHTMEFEKPGILVDSFAYHSITCNFDVLENKEAHSYDELFPQEPQEARCSVIIFPTTAELPDGIAGFMEKESEEIRRTAEEFMQSKPLKESQLITEDKLFGQMLDGTENASLEDRENQIRVSAPDKQLDEAIEVALSSFFHFFGSKDLRRALPEEISTIRWECARKFFYFVDFERHLRFYPDPDKEGDVLLSSSKRLLKPRAYGLDFREFSEQKIAIEFGMITFL